MSKLFAALLSLLLLGTFLYMSDRAIAQEQFELPVQCSKSGSAASAAATVPAGDYVISYNQVPKGTVVYMSTPDRACQKNPKTFSASDSTFVLVEVLSLNDATSLGGIELIDRDVSRNDCTRGDCTKTYQEETFELIPRKLSSAYDSFSIFIKSDSDKAALSGVEHAVGGKVVQRSNQYKKLNENFIPAGNHTVTTVLTFDNGARLQLVYDVSRGTAADVHLHVISWFYRNGVVLRYLLYIMLFVAGGLTLLFIYSVVQNRRRWLATHDVTSKWSKAGLSPGRLLRKNPDEQINYFVLVRKPAAVLLAVSLLFIGVVQFVAVTIRTDGISMQDTLADNQQLLVSKLGKTLSSINGSDYVPKRGDIIIVRNNSIGAEDTSNEAGLVVKRVIGVPGDTVTYDSGVFKVRGESGGVSENWDEQEQEWTRSVKKGNIHPPLEDTLGIGEIFIAGDNRDNSIDSRFYGPITASQIVGVVVRAL